MMIYSLPGVRGSALTTGNVHRERLLHSGFGSHHPFHTLHWAQDRLFLARMGIIVGVIVHTGRRSTFLLPSCLTECPQPGNRSVALVRSLRALL